MPFLTDLADNLRAYTAPDGSKLTVVEIAGWRARGYAGWGLTSADGHMYHHTATAKQAFNFADAPTLNLLVNGRADLPGPLCNIALGRSGTVYVVAAGWANHAGPGSIGGGYVNVGNAYFIGNEMESSGTSNDWTDDQNRVMPHVGAALEQAYGGPDFIQIGHKEYSSMGKIDPGFKDMDQVRDSINDLLYNDPKNEGDWLAMATKEDVKDAVREVLNEPIKRQGGEKGHTSIIAETAWKTARDNRLESKVNTLQRRVFHLWQDWHLGVAGRVFDGPVGPLVRKLGYKDPDNRAEVFKDAEKKEWA
ncbi:N-acetylmuramoyl-L-alanine amidase [Rothia sp. P4278]|uniref:N-acetylmuramoyl-L-alanine amidase n=1 Tax=Rothia sp. P4278 TaxID=3402658 RepID=UPI003ADB8EFD